MRGILAHFLLTLRLNFKSRQALVYGYLVPVFFLIAFGSIFRSSNPPLLRQLGQLLTISVLGGACFGMPTAMVAERERGIWRRYRLLPAATGSLVISTMAARLVIVLSAAVMQLFLANIMYGMPLPYHPLQLAVAFTVVTFAFLGMGLIIAMLAGNVPAVQALGQALFLPMIMIGGVGVPLWTLPPWAQHLAGFLPGKYAVAALQSCASGEGLAPTRFDLLALLVIGGAACVAGAKMFRWDAQEKGDPRRWGWVALALLAWLSVGMVAEITGHARLPVDFAPVSAAGGTFESITQGQIDAVSYGDLPPDDETVTPVAKTLAGLDADGQRRIAELRRQLAGWAPANDPSEVQRVRNLLSAAGVADIAKDSYEGVIALVVFEKIHAETPPGDLQKILTWITLHPVEGKPIVEIPELGVDGQATPEEMPERIRIYATKLLGRITGKRPAPR